jgi:hypothetical protein
MSGFSMPQARTLPENRAAAMRRQLVAEVVGQPRRRRRRLLFAAGGVLVVAGATAAGYAFVPHSQPVTDKGSARCYTVASLSAGPQSFTSIGVATEVNSGRPGQVTDALGTCASLWSQGFLRAGPQGAGVPTARPSPGADNPVPPLVVCVLPDGTAAVFPGDKSTCAALSLPSAGG